MAHDEEEALLRAAADKLRASMAPEDPRLEAFSHGLLGPQDEAHLAEEAEGDPELARDVALYSPLSSEARARLFEAVKVKRRRPRWPVWIGAVALAAGLVGLTFLRSPDPLPRYAFEVEVRQASLRGDPGEGVREVRADTEVSLVLKPSRRVTASVEPALYVIEGPEARRSPAPVERSEDGAFRWRGPAGALAGVPAGRVRLVAVVARPGAGPAPRDLEIAPAEGAGWQSAGVELTITPVGGS